MARKRKRRQQTLLVHIVDEEVEVSSERGQRRGNPKKLRSNRPQNRGRRRQQGRSRSKEQGTREGRSEEVRFIGVLDPPNDDMVRVSCDINRHGPWAKFLIWLNDTL